jgi:hypothetical protein
VMRSSVTSVPQPIPDLRRRPRWAYNAYASGLRGSALHAPKLPVRALAIGHLLGLRDQQLRTHEAETPAIDE